jgi:hypothetical protein
VLRKAGVFSVSFAAGLHYASFGSWKSSFAKLAERRAERSWGGYFDLPARALSWSSSLPMGFMNT